MIQLIVDALCDISKEEMERMDVIQLPYVFTINGVEYLSTEVSMDEILDYIEKGIEIQTSRPSLGIWSDILEKPLSEGKDILYIASTGKMTGALNSYKVICNLKKSTYSNKMKYVDTTLISYMAELMLERAFEMIDRPIEEIVSTIKRESFKCNGFYLLESTEFLINNRRFDKYVNNYPIIIGKEGLIEVSSINGDKKTGLRSISKSINLIDHSKAYIVHTSDVLSEDIEFLKDSTGITETRQINNVLYTYVGPHTIGVCYIRK